MEVTEAVTVVHGDRGPGRIVFRADDEALTPFAGLVCVGEVARRIGLVELIDGELAGERRAVPVKRRRCSWPSAFGVVCVRPSSAASRAGERLDRALGREAGEPVTIDLDATVLEVYGRGKRGASRNRAGQPRLRAAR